MNKESLKNSFLEGVKVTAALLLVVPVGVLNQFFSMVGDAMYDTSRVASFFCKHTSDWKYDLRELISVF